MTKFARNLVGFSLLLLVLAGCSVKQPVAERPVIGHQFVLPAAPFPLLQVPQEAQIFRLNDVQRQDFIDYYHAPENQHIDAHHRLYQYLELIVDGFHFQGKTYDAAMALDKQSGNCLSLAILTTALARLVDLEFSYQRVNSAPIYHRYHNVMTLSSHVRTKLYDPEFEKEKNTIVVNRPGLIIDYFPQSGNVAGDRVNFADFIAMYYQNLAGDALVKEQFQLAYSLLIRGWQQAPDNPETLNSLAVLYKKLGRVRDAEYLYAYALEKGIASVNVLSNYHLLLNQQGRTDEAKVLEQRLLEVNDDNPYRWFDVADRQFAKSNFSIALKYYKRALEQAPYLHEGYFGLAKVYFSLGMEDEAKKALNRALELTYIPEEQRLYQSKLKVLEALQMD